MRTTNWLRILADKSEKEKELDALIDAENDKFESSRKYKDYRKKIKELYTELDKARNERLKQFRDQHPERRAIEKTEDLKDIMTRREANKKRHEEWVASLPQNVKDAFAIYKEMTPEERKKFHKFIRIECPYEGLDNYENPITTEDDIDLLQHILVQTTIEFIKERNLTDIWSVGFGVDDLQSSVKYGEWHPASDSSIEVEGIQNDVRRLIGSQI